MGSDRDKENEKGRPSGKGKASFSVVRGGKAQPRSGARGGSYESDAQALADIWDPRKRAEREERQRAEEARQKEQAATRAEAAAGAQAERDSRPADAKGQAKRKMRESLADTVPDVNPQLQSRRQRRTPLADWAAEENAAQTAAASAKEPTTEQPAPRVAAAPVAEAAGVEQHVPVKKQARVQAFRQEMPAMDEPLPADAQIPLWEAGVEEGSAASLEPQGPPNTDVADGEAGSAGAEAPDAPAGAASDEEGLEPASGGAEEQPAPGADEAAQDAKPKKPSRRKAGSAPAQDESQDRQAGRRFRIKPGVVVGIVLAVIVIAVACVVGYLCMLRWTWADDATDLQGSWHLSGKPTSVVITSDTINLADAAEYTYTLDTQAKVIEEKLGNMTGSARYRFSTDRNSVALLDDGSSDWWANALDDLNWYKDVVIAQVTGGTMPDLLHGESGIVIYRQGYDAVGVVTSQTTGVTSTATNVEAVAGAEDATTNAEGEASDAGAAEDVASAGAGAAATGSVG